MKVKAKLVFGFIFSLLCVSVFAQEVTDSVVQSVEENAASEIEAAQIDVVETVEETVLSEVEAGVVEGESVAADENAASVAAVTEVTESAVFDLSKIEVLKPHSMSETVDGTAGIVVETDVINADVYLNGNFQGKTDLEVTNLLPGMYVLEVKKNGYQDKIFQIEVQPGVSATFKIGMTELLGTLTLKNLKPGINIQIDGYQFKKILTVAENQKSFTQTLKPGRYFISFSKFGFESSQVQVYVNAFEDTEVKVQMNEIQMMVTGLRANRKTINPEYNNIYGKVIFTFFVSASSPMEAYIVDERGNEVWRTEWESFDTWKQGFVWDGSYKDIGSKVPDGKYNVHISSDHFEYTLGINVNRNVHYPLLTPTAVGSGIGDLPALYGYSEPYFAPFVTAAPMGKLENGQFSFYDVKTTAGFIINGGRGREFTLTGNLNPGYGNGFIGGFSTAIKFYGIAPLNEKGSSLSLGLLLRYGFTNAPFANMTGVDVGNGLGGGLLFNLDGKYLNGGLSSQFIFGSQNGLLNKKDNLWKNGATFSVKMGNTVRTDFWCALCSYFGEETSWVKALDSGVDLKFMLGQSNALFDMNFNYTNIFGSTQFFTQSFGLYYLF